LIQKEITDEIISVLNTSGYDPLSDRVGSMWFDEDQEIFFTKLMPKGTVYFNSEEESDRSHGNNFKSTKSIIVDCVIFTKKGDKDPSTTYKDKHLIQYILNDVEIKLKAANLTKSSLVGFGEMNNVVYDKGNMVFVGKKPVILRYRE
jgi:hypothetical protein